MPRRSSASALNTASVEPRAPSPVVHPASPSEAVVELRRQWKWAAFSQFFYTFSTLFNTPDVTIADIEVDLTCSSSLVLPRILQRLLYTLSQDRKVNLENWQTALRKQYLKRDPQANPIGPEPARESEDGSSPTPNDIQVEGENTPMISTTHHTPAPEYIVQKEGNDTGDTEKAIQDIADLAADEPTEQAVKEELQSLEESRDWLELPMLVKLDSMHLLTEWQFQNSQRLRTLMKNDDEAATWRIEPIGYDAKSNAYWLIGPDRLWIQRFPPKRQACKRKRIGGLNDRKVMHAANGKSTADKRTTYEESTKQTTASTSNRSRSGAEQSARTNVSGRGGGRAAKAEAKVKMNAQAKDLAEFQKQAAASVKSKGKSATLPPPLRGTRLSKRLRGAGGEEEWQPVPEEWLSYDNANRPAKAIPKTGLESDDDSALTSLSGDDEDVAGGSENSDVEPEADAKPAEQEDADILDDRRMQIPIDMPKDFVEWETIALTLEEWEHVADPFAKATHYTEKALYRTLIMEIVPVVVGELKEIERKRHLEEALVHRKRSSRIAIKESEKEEAEMMAKKKAEDQEKLSRARRLEVRQVKEEVDRVKRETAREQRRREREQRELQPRQDLKRDRDESTDMAIDLVGSGPPSKSYHSNGFHTRNPNGSTSGSGSGARTPAGEDWELDCEICRRHGMNQDDGQPMMSCGVCSKWQHISCHDDADARAGRSKRNWDAEEFLCHRCRSRNYGGAYQGYQSKQYPTTQSQPQAHPVSFGSHLNRHMPARGQVGYSGVQPYASAVPPEQSRDTYRTSMPAAVPQSSNQLQQPAITFAHYQPDTQGHSTRQTYQRDIPTPQTHQRDISAPQTYQQIASTQQPYHQHPYRQQPYQQPYRQLTPQTHEPGVSPAPLQPPAPQMQYGNGSWNTESPQQQYTSYASPSYATQAHRASDPHSVYTAVSQWQPPHQNVDPRAQASQSYPQYNQAMGPSSYQHPR